MSVINILDKSIYNKIAAGEVVEKPASVVKELVENSIDAGATNITIEILEGGIKQIKVSDNGCGIAKDDFDKVFLAHATSKIKTVEDLGKIGTLGFRGEALSSIASVSKVTLSSGRKSPFPLPEIMFFSDAEDMYLLAQWLSDTSLKGIEAVLGVSLLHIRHIRVAISALDTKLLGLKVPSS